MNSLKLALKNHSLVYIARDLERALGLPKDYENYHSITNATPFAKQLIKSPESRVQSPKVLLIESDRLLDSHELLTHPTTDAFLKTLHNPQVLVFKNTTVIENICREQGYTLLNPPARFSQMVEEKISQLEWLGELAQFLPPHRVEILKNSSFADVEGKILQVNRAHTGSGTIHVTDKQIFADLQAKFPNRPVRITDFVAGPMLTNNNVVWGTHVLSGPINYQITGLLPFTDRPFATIGNDWALPHTLLSPQLLKSYQSIAQAVGKKLANEGWRGLFGIDVVLDEKQQKLYLIEINARQPASTTFESNLQQKIVPQYQISHIKYLTTFEAHLSGLLNLPYEGQEIIPLTDGAQIIQRVREHHTAPLASATASLTAAGFTVTPYTNTKPGEDLLRIQSPRGVMNKHNVFNEVGKHIAGNLSL